MALYRDRSHAGRELAKELSIYAGRRDVVVLGLPRGGVPVAFEVAQTLGAPLDVFLVRKLGVPGHRELAMGAIASGDVLVLNDDVIQALGISSQAIESVAAEEREVLHEQEQAYRGSRPGIDVRGRAVIIVDDGLATGASMLAAVQALRPRGPARIVIAVPTAPPETCAQFRELVDDVVCPATPTPFYGVGAWYDDFTQTSDDRVRELLSEPTSIE
ncbi:MAG: phosphoribosyltransferase [Anaerolineae bacterium]|nr:phosphoribosyltransferase [Anaerolineae bacterium]